MSMNNARDIGLRNGIIFNCGNYAGHFLVMLTCLIFSKFLYVILPQIQLPMKILGAAYLFYLIVKIIFPVSQHKVKENNRSLAIGVLLQLVNIKVILFGLTVMSAYLLPYYKSVPILILFAFLMSSIQFGANIAWTLSGSLINKLFIDHKMILNIIMIILLIYCIVKLFI
jgi:threonine/homoserine/homoserine lactone efflux protein